MLHSKLYSIGKKWNIYLHMKIISHSHSSTFHIRHMRCCVFHPFAALSLSAISLLRAMCTQLNIIKVDHKILVQTRNMTRRWWESDFAYISIQTQSPFHIYTKQCLLILKILTAAYALHFTQCNVCMYVWPNNAHNPLHGPQSWQESSNSKSNDRRTWALMKSCNFPELMQCVSEKGFCTSQQISSRILSLIKPAHRTILKVVYTADANSHL